MDSQFQRFVSLDVSSALPFAGETNRVAADVHLPAGDPAAMLVCWPGGSYGRSYWQFDSPPGYDFAAYMVERGFAVVAADPLGVGDSSRPSDVDAVTLEAVAQAAAAFTRQLHAELALPERTRVVGVGHSLGGAITVIAQALGGCYDRVVSLGYTHGAKDAVTADVDEADTHAAAVAQAKAFFADWEAGYATAPRAPNHSWLYTASTPAEVIAADDATVRAWPRQTYVEALMDGFTASYASKITCPLLLVFGDHDVPERPHDDLPLYTGSPDVSLLIARDSAHCHNFSPSRFWLWERIGEWAAQPEPAIARSPVA